MKKRIPPCMQVAVQNRIRKEAAKVYIRLLARNNNQPDETTDKPHKKTH